MKTTTESDCYCLGVILAQYLYEKHSRWTVLHLMIHIQWQHSVLMQEVVCHLCSKAESGGVKVSDAIILEPPSFLGIYCYLRYTVCL